MARTQKKWSAANIKRFKELCGVFATRDEICADMGLSPKTLNRLINEHLHDEINPDSDEPVTFQDAFSIYSAAARGSLRRKQFELAMNGDRTMLIWLGKQYLEQKDTKQTVEIEDDNTNAEEAINDIIGRILDAGAGITQSE